MFFCFFQIEKIITKKWEIFGGGGEDEEYPLHRFIVTYVTNLN